jgi:hypothetical protein
MKYIVRQERVIIEDCGKLVGVNVVDVYYQLLEDGISYPKLLKEGYEPDKIVLTESGEVVLLRDEDFEPNVIKKSDLIQKLEITSRYHKNSTNDDFYIYYTGLVNKIQSYERELKLEKLLNEPIQESEDIWI